jgi:hypothetical protein
MSTTIVVAITVLISAAIRAGISRLWSRGCRRGVWRATVVAMAALVLTPMGVGVAGAQDLGTDDVPAGAVDLADPNRNFRIHAAADRPGDRDWYAIRGTEPPYLASLRITNGAAPADCPPPANIVATLHNPEGHWMSTHIASAGASVKIRLPQLPDRYLIAVWAGNRTCSGLSYSLTPEIVGGQVNVVDPALRCRIAHETVIRERDELRRLQRRLRQVSAPARPRYRRHLRRAQRELRTARRSERIRCAEVE